MQWGLKVECMSVKMYIGIYQIPINDTFLNCLYSGLLIENEGSTN